MPTIDPVRTLALGYGIVLLIGVILGCRGNIVVFKDMRDLVTTFAIIAGTALLAFFVAGIGDLKSNESALLFATTALIVVATISYRTSRHNRSVLATALAVLTKVPFSIAVPLLVIQVAAPTGQTAAQRAAKRASALLLLTIIGPLMLALVDDKDGLRRYLGVN